MAESITLVIGSSKRSFIGCLLMIQLQLGKELHFFFCIFSHKVRFYFEPTACSPAVSCPVYLQQLRFACEADICLPSRVSAAIIQPLLEIGRFICYSEALRAAKDNQ